jgi:hypothetical protein
MPERRVLTDLERGRSGADVNESRWRSSSLLGFAARRLARQRFSLVLRIFRHSSVGRVACEVLTVANESYNLSHNATGAVNV